MIPYFVHFSFWFFKKYTLNSFCFHLDLEDTSISDDEAFISPTPAKKALPGKRQLSCPKKKIKGRLSLHKTI